MAAKLELVRAEYQGTEIWFDEQGWINATQAAARFGKRVDHYLENAETKEYISALSEEENISNTRNSGYLKTRRGNQGGTWFHPDLSIHFARWLDVRFAIWCDRLVRQVLSGQHPHFDWRKLRHGDSSANKVRNEALRLVREEQCKLTEEHHYANEARMINKILAGKWDKFDRDNATIGQLDLSMKLNIRDSVLMGRGLSYDDRKKMLEHYAIDLRPAPLAIAQ